MDTTNIPTWAPEQSQLDGVVGTKKLENTHYAYQIPSAQVVSDGMPFQNCNVCLLLADADFASGRIATN